MTNRKRNPGARRDASGAGKPVHSAAEGKSALARQKRCVTFIVTPYNPDATSVSIAASGRVLWTLKRLLAASKGAGTPIIELAPRSTVYVHTPCSLGVSIETVWEKHEGTLPNNHARSAPQAIVTQRTEGGTSDGQKI